MYPRANSFLVQRPEVGGGGEGGGGSSSGGGVLASVPLVSQTIEVQKVWLA